jgi:hypothetical protein
MRAKFGNIFSMFFILLFSVTQSPAQQESTFKKFAGTYVTGHEFGGGSIKLEADGTFSDGGGSDDGTEISTSGNYTLSNGVLHFKITKQTGKRAGDRKEFNLLNLEERKEMFRGDDSGEVEREFKYLPIEWSERIYLINEIDLKDFANAINLGLEPRSSLTSGWDTLPWYGSFYLRSGDEQKKVTGIPNLPEKWLSFLLRKPVTATVISVQKIEKKQFITISTATINKGSKDGLKIGMKLLSKDEVPSQWDGAEVVSVEKATAKIQARLSKAELKIGDKLSTIYKPKMLYR